MIGVYNPNKICEVFIILITLIIGLCHLSHSCTISKPVKGLYLKIIASICICSHCGAAVPICTLLLQVLSHKCPVSVDSWIGSSSIDHALLKDICTLQLQRLLV